MEFTKNKLSDDVQVFLRSIKQALEIDFVFYGSIQRPDYYRGSDIDISIFTDNVSSVISKLATYLDVDKRRIKRTFSMSPGKYNPVLGNKIYYVSDKLSSPVEFSIYNVKDKDELLRRYHSKLNIPIYVSVLLIITKFMFHTLRLIDLNRYRDIKAFLLSTALGKRPDIFIPLI